MPPPRKRKPGPRPGAGRPAKPPQRPARRMRSGPWKAESPGDGSPAGEQAPGDRLQKVLAAAGLASRRECEELIREGRVEIDGQIVTELGVRVDRRTQTIRVDGEPLAKPKLVYVAVHKPAGVVTTARDPAGRPRITDLVPPSLGRVFPVGRLDLESEGLILLTNDGELAERLAHPRHGVRKVYEVQVAGEPAPDVLAQLKRGVYLSEGYSHAVDIKVRGRKKKSTLLEMTLDEGRNREIRRLLARVGHKVQRLTRIAVGPLRLGELPRGAYRLLTPEEVRKLRVAGPESDTSAPTAPSRGPRGGSPGKTRPAAGKSRPGRPGKGRAAGPKKRPTTAGAVPPREGQRQGAPSGVGRRKTKPHSPDDAAISSTSGGVGSGRRVIGADPSPTVDERSGDARAGKPAKSGRRFAKKGARPGKPPAGKQGRRPGKPGGKKRAVKRRREGE